MSFAELFSIFFELKGTYLFSYRENQIPTVSITVIIEYFSVYVVYYRIF